MMENIAKGTKFGKLTVIEDLGMVLQKSGKKRHFVKCLCDCGTIKDINWYDLKGGKIRSCGCFFKKMISDLGKKVTKERKGNPKHNLCHTRQYIIYNEIKGKLFNKNNKRYNLCGGSGIKMCSEWLNDFKSFYNGQRIMVFLMKNVRLKEKTQMVIIVQKIVLYAPRKKLNTTFGVINHLAR